MMTELDCLALVLIAAVLLLAGLLRDDDKDAARVGLWSALAALGAIALVVGDTL
jgi:hypothetical protein